MTKKEKQKAIDVLKISAPVMVVTQEEFNAYIKTLNKIMNWLEQEPTTKNYVPDNDAGKIDCENTDCNNCVNHKYCDYEPNKSEISTGSTAKNNLAVDAISRTEAQTKIEMNASRYTISKERGGMGQVEWSDQLIKVSDAVNIIRELPPATPQPRKGHWVLTDVEGDRVWHCHCSECGKDPQDYVGGSENWWLIKSKLPKFCPNCGSRNEVEE